MSDRPTDRCLSTARCGEWLRIVSVRDTRGAAVRLRQLGFCETMEICKLSDRGVCLCQLSGRRVAIARELAGDVLVEKL